MSYQALTALMTIAAGEVLTAAVVQQINDNGEFLIDPPACSIKETTAQSLADNTSTAMTSNEENFDNDSMHSTVTNTSRITIQTAGRYLISATVAFAANTVGVRYIAFRVNGTTYYDFAQVDATQTLGTEISGMRPVVLAAAAYVEIIA